MSTDNFQTPVPFNITMFTIEWGCEYVYTSVTSKGLFQRDDPLKRSLIAIMMQLGTAILMTTFLRRLLRPLNQPRFVAEMLTAVVLGPSIMQHFNSTNFFQSFYTYKHTAIMTFFEFFSIFMYEFLLGTQIDLNVITNSGKLGWVLGLSAFALPNILTILVSSLLTKAHADQASNLGQVSMFVPIITLPVTIILLKDVKLLNSEIGRLAVSASIISNACGWLYTTFETLIMFGTFFKFTTWDYFKTTAPKFLYMLLAAFGLRPIMYWMIKKIPEGRSLKQWQFLAIIMMVFAVGFFNESLGHTAAFGSLILGMVIPAGPPLGSGMLEKANLFVTAVLLPSYLLGVGHSVDVFSVGAQNFWLIMVLLIASTVGKILAAVVPMKVFGVPNKDAFALGLILSSQGFFDVITAKRLFTYTQITQESYTIITLGIWLNAFITTPILGYIYDPSKRYINYKRRTIQHSLQETEIKVLVCIHEEEQVLGIFKILKAFYPTKKNPIVMYAIDLMELVGRMTPIFINHRYHKYRSLAATTNRTDRIINAFQQFETQHEGIKRYNFTAIAPYNSMHDEICTLALDKTVSFLIIPYQKSDTSPVRGVMKNVLDKAPCSVGILINKGIIVSFDVRSFCCHACVAFLGGPDAREALAFATRMLENVSTRVTVIRLIAEDEYISDMLEMKLDIRAITELKSLYGEEGGRLQYKEEVVRDGAHTMEVLRSIDNEYDLMLVGRRLDDDSPLVSGLADWTYEPELGIVGDVLASKDVKSTAPILVIQQQSTVEDMLHIDRAKKLS